MPRYALAEPIRREESAQLRRSATPPPASQLTVGAADDTAERAADAMADRALARLASEPAALERQHGAAGAPPTHEPERRRAAPQSVAAPETVGREGGAAPQGVADAVANARGGGEPLAEPVRARMEQAMGADFSAVRIHADERSAQAASALSSLAYTQGSDVYFGEGQYRPDTPTGERTLAHELAHVVQGGSTSRRMIRRLWDLNARQLDWQQTDSIRTLPTRHVWFFEDRGGDTMVVKPEDQPVGLGVLVGAMHQRLTPNTSVKQRKLTNDDKQWVQLLMENFTENFDRSWAAVGGNADLGGDPNADDLIEAGKSAAVAKLRSSENVIAMSMAKGDAAEKLAEPDPNSNANDAGRSRYRRLLEDDAHMRLLGEMTAVDLFMGNKDRVMTGNLGNWFYNPQGTLDLIDHVDPGGGMGNGFQMVGEMADNTKWRKANGPGGLLASSKLAATSKQAVVKLLAGAANLGGDDYDEVVAWGKQRLLTKTREEVMAESFLVGLTAGRRRIKKVFTSSKWNNVSKRKAKKEMKKVARGASALDANDQVFAGSGGVDYYAVLKERAAWLDKN